MAIIELNERSSQIVDDLLFNLDKQDDVKAFTESSAVEFSLILAQQLMNAPPELPSIFVLAMAIKQFVGEDDDDIGGDDGLSFILE